MEPGRSRSVISAVCLTAVCLGPNTCSPSRVTAADDTVRQRLEKAASGSRELLAKARPMSEEMLKQLCLQAEMEQDQPALEENHFPRLADVQAYLKLRPQAVAYRDRFGQSALRNAVQTWPTPAEAPILRELLRDQDAAIRSLAIEALATLHLPDDVGRIGRFLDDEAAAAPVLANCFQISSMGIPQANAPDDLVTHLVWSDRSVSAYARAALRLMTGHRFDQKDPPDVTFSQWWETHNLGKESLWYWQERLLREQEVWRPASEAKARRAAAHRATVAELKGLSAEVEAKVYLVTTRGMDNPDVIGPINEFFPEDISLRINRDRMLELLEGGLLWPDSDDVPEAEAMVFNRLGRLAPTMLPKEDWPRARAALEKFAPGTRWTQILVSRLLPTAEAGHEDDSETREGYLRQALDHAQEGYTRDMLAAEMVRSNLEAQWPALVKIFYTEAERHAEGSDARLGILKAIGEPPCTNRKLAALVELVNDSRNDTLLTQVNERMGMDMYRHYAAQSLNELAGREYISFTLRQDLGIPERSKPALAELRRLAAELQQSKAKAPNASR
jgi:hypothetical protein